MLFLNQKKRTSVHSFFWQLAPLFKTYVRMFFLEFLHVDVLISDLYSVFKHKQNDINEDCKLQTNNMPLIKPHYEKTVFFLHMRKQRRRSAVR